MPKAIETLNSDLDTLYAPTGTIGYLILLNNTLTTGLSFTVNTGTEELTTSAAHNLVTGSRVRVASTGVAPTPLNTATDYYAIVVSGTVIKLATTLANALADTAINLTDSGSGTLTLNEQILNQTDSLAVLINHELSHADYTRKAITDIGAAASGQKTFTATYTANAPNGNMTWRHRLIIKGGSATIGNTTGTKDEFFNEGSEQTLLQGQSTPLNIVFRHQQG